MFRLLGLLIASAVITMAAPGGLTITTTSLPAGIQGESYNQTLTATGGTGSVTWSIVSPGVLPPVLSLNSATGAIIGTPTTLGSANFTVMATASNTATQPLTIQINRSGQISYVVVDQTTNSLIRVAADGSGFECNTHALSHSRMEQQGEPVRTFYL
jgi:hypothetical protein